MLFSKLYEATGNTPLVKLNDNIYAKLEGFNPTGSAKDRAALEMILAAQKEGKIKEGGTIIEPTSGNTGIALCSIAVQMGYKAIICMPSNMSKERIKLMEILGASIVLTPKELGMKGSIDKATELQASIPNSFIPAQFDNKANALAHFKTTGPEILADLPDVDVFVAGIGTGGTITGVGQYLKMKKECYIVGVEPAASPLLTKGVVGSHKIQGIGANFIPSILDTNLLDEVVDIENADAFAGAKEIMKTYGIFVGISGGAAYMGAKKMHAKFPNKKIVVLFPDDVTKYLSTELFNE